MREEPQERRRSTAPPELPLTALRRSRNARHGGIACLLVVLILGALGVLGVTDVTASSRADDIELEVRYARVARTGLTAPLSNVVRAQRISV